MSLESIEAQLTGPGGPFEVVEEDVLGSRIAMCKTRPASLRTLLEDSVARGDAEYMVYDDRRITFAEHERMVASVAKAFSQKYGVGRGDRVAILAANCSEWVVAFWATVSLGAVAVGLNGWWKRGEILYAIEQTEPALLIGDAARLARLEAGDIDIPVVSMEDDFEKLLRFDPEADLPSDPIEEDQPAVILFPWCTSRRKGHETRRRLAGYGQP